MLEELFAPSVERIIVKLIEILEHCGDMEIETIILVGGYSESQYLRERIQSVFSHMRVILLDDARLAVLNGAVMMGWKPKNIIQHRSRFTYGFAMKQPFIENGDPEYLKVIIDGDIFCDKVFNKVIQKGKMLEYGQTFTYTVSCAAFEQEMKDDVIYIGLWRSTLEDPQYCIEEEGCSLVGEIAVIPPPEGWPDYWEAVLHLIVGETEFTVKYFDLETGNELEAKMDFL
jgi:hypothetical protein